MAVTGFRKTCDYTSKPMFVVASKSLRYGNCSNIDRKLMAGQSQCFVFQPPQKGDFRAASLRNPSKARPDAGSSLTQIHYQQLGFGHFFDRITQAFATESGIFHSTVRHMINTEAGHIARQQPADLEFVERLEHELGIAREDAGL